MTEKQAELLQQVATDIAVLKNAIIGNGTKGLSDRMIAVEEWKGGHPRACPLPEHIEATENTPKQGRANRWVIIGVVVASVTGAAGLVIGVFK